MGIHQDGRAVSQAHPDTDNSRISGGLGASGAALSLFTVMALGNLAGLW